MTNKFFDEETKKKIVAEFNNRHGMYTRLYNMQNKSHNGLKDPIGVMYRCHSTVENDRVIILAYTWSNNPRLTKDEYTNNLFVGMSIALKNADRYLKKCKKNNIPIDDYIELQVRPYDETVKNATKYIEVFKNRMNKYYKKPMKVIIVWM